VNFHTICSLRKAVVRNGCDWIANSPDEINTQTQLWYPFFRLNNATP